MSIHPTAIVASDAELGEGVIVGPYAIIEEHVFLGAGTVVEAHAMIRAYTRMGMDNHVYPHAVVGGIPQDLKFNGEESWLEIGDNNTIREFSTSHRGTKDGGGFTRIGHNNLLMAYTHVAHDCQVGNHVIMSNAATLAGHVQVNDHAIIGGLSAIHQFSRIGRHAFVGGMTGIGQDVPPWTLASGSRASLHGLNVVGMRRAGCSREVIAALKNAFRLVCRSEMLRSEALEQLEQEYAALPEVMEFIMFVRHSERGLCPAEKGSENEKNFKNEK